MEVYSTCSHSIITSDFHLIKDLHLLEKCKKRLFEVFKTTDREDITRWREDMNFMLEWQEQYLTSERSERMRYCSYHENIKFISSSQRVMFFLLYGETNSTKAKSGNRDVIERYDTHKGDIRKIRH